MTSPHSTPALDPRRTAGGVDAQPGHRRGAQQDGVAEPARERRRAVAGALRRDPQAGRGGGADDPATSWRDGRVGDGRRMVVDLEVPGHPRLVVEGVAGQVDGTSAQPAQRLGVGGRRAWTLAPSPPHDLGAPAWPAELEDDLSRRLMPLVEERALARRDVGVDRVAHQRVHEVQWVPVEKDLAAGEHVEGAATSSSECCARSATAHQVGHRPEHRHRSRDRGDGRRHATQAERHERGDRARPHRPDRVDVGRVGRNALVGQCAQAAGAGAAGCPRSSCGRWRRTRRRRDRAGRSPARRCPAR